MKLRNKQTGETITLENDRELALLKFVESSLPNGFILWEEVKETTRWKPEQDQEYYYLVSDCSVRYDTFCDDFELDQDRFDIGNCFKTEEEAKQVAEYLKALAVVRGDATTEFTRGKSNWFVYLDAGHNSLYSTCSYYIYSKGVFGLPYFATEDDARRSIELHKKEWLTIFGVKEKE